MQRSFTKHGNRVGCRHCSAGDRRGPADAGDKYLRKPGRAQRPRLTAGPLRRPTKPKPLVLTTEKDKQSYAIGLNVGKSLHRDDIDVDPKIVLQGLQDAMADGKLL